MIGNTGRMGTGDDLNKVTGGSTTSNDENNEATTTSTTSKQSNRYDYHHHHHGTTTTEEEIQHETITRNNENQALQEERPLHVRRDTSLDDLSSRDSTPESSNVTNNTQPLHNEKGESSLPNDVGTSVVDGTTTTQVVASKSKKEQRHPPRAAHSASSSSSYPLPRSSRQKRRQQETLRPELELLERFPPPPSKRLRKAVSWDDKDPFFDVFCPTSTTSTTPTGLAEAATRSVTYPHAMPMGPTIPPHLLEDTLSKHGDDEFHFDKEVDPPPIQDSPELPIVARALASSGQGQGSSGGLSSPSSSCSYNSVTFPPIPPAPPSTPDSHFLETHHHPCDELQQQHHPSPYAAFSEMATPLPEDMTPTQRQIHHDYITQQEQPPQTASCEPETDHPPSRTTTTTTTPNHQSPSTPRTETDFSEWAVGDRYQMMRILGRGSYGEVAQARDLLFFQQQTVSQQQQQQSQYVAIKRITSAFDQEVDAVRIYREMYILRRLRGHKCIIQLIDVVPPADFESFNDLYLVFEYVDTDLYKLIMSPQYLTTEHIKTFLYQLLSSLKYIHSLYVIHRDLKPANILLNEDCSLKICDFGLARTVNSAPPPSSLKRDDNKTSSKSGPRMKAPIEEGSLPPKTNLTRQLTKHVVTRWYRAPELILIQPYTSAVDMWSLGCILAELLSMQENNVPGYQDRKPLFPGGSCYPLSGEGASIKNDERLDQLSVIFGVIGTPDAEDVESIGQAKEYLKSLKKKTGKRLETMFPAADPAAIDLLSKMLQFNPTKRCTAEEALEHDFLKSVRKKETEISADQPLVCPEFLEKNNIDIATLKKQTYQEVLWYKERKQKQPPTNCDNEFEGGSSSEHG